MLTKRGRNKRERRTFNTERKPHGGQKKRIDRNKKWIREISQQTYLDEYLM